MMSASQYPSPSSLPPSRSICSSGRRNRIFLRQFPSLKPQLLEKPMPQPNIPVPGEPVITPPVEPNVPPLPGPDIPPLPEEEPGIDVPIEDPPYNPSFPDAPEIQPLIA
jgi:hypothetical protein